MASKTQKQMIQEIFTVLLGVPDTDDRGLVGLVDYVVKDHNRLKKNFWMLVGILVGSGVIASSVFGLLNG